MIPYRPNVHCPHVGYVPIQTFYLYTDGKDSPSGGGMCIKRNVSVTLPLADFHRVDTPHQQYINETTQNLYPIPFLPLSLS